MTNVSGKNNFSDKLGNMVSCSNRCLRWYRKIPVEIMLHSDMSVSSEKLGELRWIVSLSQPMVKAPVIPAGRNQSNLDRVSVSWASFRLFCAKFCASACIPRRSHLGPHHKVQPLATDTTLKFTFSARPIELGWALVLRMEPS